MAIIEILVAAAAAWLFGAVWYGLLSKRWMAASRLTAEDLRVAGKAPFAISFLCAVVVAAMTRHILSASGIENAVAGALGGLGLGLFVAAPWIVTNVFYGNRDKALIWIDGGYPAVGMTLMGLVLGLL